MFTHTLKRTGAHTHTQVMFAFVIRKLFSVLLPLFDLTGTLIPCLAVSGSAFTHPEVLRCALTPAHPPWADGVWFSHFKSSFNRQQMVKAIAPGPIWLCKQTMLKRSFQDIIRRSESKWFGGLLFRHALRLCGTACMCMFIFRARFA